MSGNRIDGGRLFQSLGPATWKALSPSLVSQLVLKMQ